VTVDVEIAGFPGTFPLAATPWRCTTELGALVRCTAVGVLLFEYPAPQDPEARGPADRQVSGSHRRSRTGVSKSPEPAWAQAPGASASSARGITPPRCCFLPHLAGDEHVELRHVATNRSLPAMNAQRRFGFSTVSTDADAVLGDDAVDAVFIVTRHHSHADLTCRALEAGKAVFVEKPLALSDEELSRILDVVAATGNDRLMVGFNRRFAPMLVEMRSRFGRSTEGAVARYSVNAGTLGEHSWYRDETLEGSRFAGEGGHFIDTVSWWLDALPTEVHATATRDPHDLQVGLRFDDGSIATITYVTNGNVRYPKEVFDVAARGRSARLENFRRAQVWTGRRRHTARAWGSVDKGQRQELERFVEVVRTGQAMPISLASLAATTRATLAVARSQSSGHPEPV
jgi:predicted dehydrogenase